MQQYGIFMRNALALFLVMLGAGQLIVVFGRLYGVSLVGSHRWLGSGVGVGLLLSGLLLLTPSWWLLALLPPAIILAVTVLVFGGSFIAPIAPPETLFTAEHPAHGGCRPVKIPDGKFEGPGLLLRPPTAAGDLYAAVCIVPGAGDTKTFFKWRLVEALLATGLTVLVIDPPGHGDYRQRPMDYPDCLSAVPAAVKYLSGLPGIDAVGVIGVSLGGALALAGHGDLPVRALVVAGTPVVLNYSRRVFYHEALHTVFSRAGLSVLREMTVKQVHNMWNSGGYTGRHRTAELFELLRPAENIRRLGRLPLLLVYSPLDRIAPPSQSEQLRQAAPHAEYFETPAVSHVLLTLTPAVNRRMAAWLVAQLVGRKKSDPGSGDCTGV
jgi:pimeloyl-ACP methyl ester carboxylesterase